MYKILLSCFVSFAYAGALVLPNQDPIRDIKQEPVNHAEDFFTAEQKIIGLSKEMAVNKKFIMDSEKTLSELKTKYNIADDMAEVLSEPNNMLAESPKEVAKEVQNAANLSAFAYEITQKQDIYSDSEYINLQEEHQTKKEIIKKLEDLKKEIFDLSNHNKSFDSKKSAIDKKLKLYNLQELQDIRNTTKDIDTRIHELNTELQNLDYKKGIHYVQKEIDKSNFKHLGLEVKGVLYRNDGEFSGFVAYNEEKKQLSLVFAGTKSWMDTITDFFGWNAKLPSHFNILQNMNFHAGFIGHLKSLPRDIFDKVNTIIKDLKTKHNLTEINIVGMGHSLGGALASIFTAAAKQVLENSGLKINANVLTFSVPNFLHAGSVKTFEEILGGKGHVFNVVNGWDPIPKAIFWKDKPGITFEIKDSLFYDKAGAMQMFGQSPHSIDVVAHGLKDEIKTLMTNTNEYKSAVKNQYQKKQELLTLKSKITEESLKATKQLNNLINITDIDKIDDLLRTLTEQFDVKRTKIIQDIKDAEARLDSSALTRLSKNIEYLEFHKESFLNILEQVKKNIEKRNKQIKEDMQGLLAKSILRNKYSK